MVELTEIPAQFASGETLTWTVTLADYTPADGYALTYHLRGPVALDLTAAPSADNLSFIVTLTAAQSGTLTKGKYYVQSYVTKGSTDKHLLVNKEIVILPNLSTETAGYDGRSDNERMLDALKAVSEKRATKHQENYTIGQRTIKYLTPTEIVTWIKYYTSLVNMERRRKAGQSPFTNIYIAFGRGSNRD